VARELAPGDVLKGVRQGTLRADDHLVARIDLELLVEVLGGEALAR
jgi:hypothetical protein